MSHWSPVETLELLRIIGERDTQAALRKMVHTRLVWESISGKMSTNRSAEHCHDRWIYLKRRYRETVLKKQTDRCANCSYYSELAKILGKLRSILGKGVGVCSGVEFIRRLILT